MFRFLPTWLSPKSDDTAGSRGEKLAADWLRRERGFAIVAQNWRSPRDQREEIDLVCRDADILVFVEVKARADDALVPGYHAVDARKRRVLRRAVRAYLSRLNPRPATFRFDVVEVSFAAQTPPAVAGAPATEPQILHFENVPLFSKHFRG